MKVLKHHILLRLASAIVAIIVVTAGIMYYRAHEAMVAAERYVSDVSRLQIGVSGAYEFATIRDTYKRYAEISSDCKEDDCTIKFHFGNGLPVQIYCARPANQYAGLTLSRGTITSSGLRSSCYGKNGGEFGAYMSESLPDASHEIPFREGRVMSSDKVAAISFSLTPAALPEQRARAYGFRDSFLSRFGPCNDATDMH